MNPAVSVIIAAYNEGSRIGPAIASVLRQTLTDLQLIIVDDGSIDGTARVLRAFADADPRVEILTNARNLGRAASRNRAIERAQASLIAVLDADDMMMPERLERQVRFMVKHAEVGMLGSGAYYLLPSSGLIRRFEPATDDSVIRRSFKQGRMVLVHPSMVFRRELLLSQGGYVKVTAHYAEDYYLCARLIEFTRAAALAEPLTIYSCEGLIDGRKLRDKHREKVEIECMLFRRRFGLRRLVSLLSHRLVSGLVPPSVEAARVRRQLARLPACSDEELKRVRGWMEHLASTCRKLQVDESRS